MKTNEIILDKSIILENEEIVEEDFNKLFSKKIDDMTEEERHNADMYVDKMLEEVDNLINSILN